MSTSSITYANAILKATLDFMKNNQDCFLIGQGVNDPNGIQGTTKDLYKKFGIERCIESPISEDGIMGFAIGLALANKTVLYTHIRMDFLLLAMNQLINIASKYSYVFAGQKSLNITIRTIIGRSWGQGAQHSQSLTSMLMNIPGLKVISTAFPSDAYLWLNQAMRDQNPVVFIEHRMLYQMEENSDLRVDESPKNMKVRREGKDLTIVSTSYSLIESLRAAKLLETKNISCDVIDVMLLNPLDINLIIDSVTKTKKILVVDIGWLNCGFASEIISRIAMHFSKDKITCSRIGMGNSACPTPRSLEEEFYPGSEKIAIKGYELVKYKNDWFPSGNLAEEIKKFKGPF